MVEFEAFLRDALGPQYDIVGFDPRGTSVLARSIDSTHTRYCTVGVGATTPPISIFRDAIESAEFFTVAVSNLNESTPSLGKLRAQVQILGDLAEERDKSVVETVSTPAVVRDMLSIVQAFGREKLQYWGFS